MLMLNYISVKLQTNKDNTAFDVKTQTTCTCIAKASLTLLARPIPMQTE